MSTVTVTTTAAVIYGFEIIIAAGAGLTQQVGYSVVSAKAKPEEVPAALGFINVAQLGSVSIALAISGSVFQNLGFRNLQQALAGYNFSDDELRSALAGAQSGLLSHGDRRCKNSQLEPLSARDQFHVRLGHSGRGFNL